MGKTLHNLNVFFDSIRNKPYKLISLSKLRGYNERFRVYEGVADLLFYETGEIIGRYYSFKTTPRENIDISELERKYFRENSLILGKAKDKHSAEVIKYYDIYPAPIDAHHLFYPYCLGTMNFGHIDDDYYFYPSVKDEDIYSQSSVQRELKRLNELEDNDELYKTEWPRSYYTGLYSSTDKIIEDINDKCDRLADSLVTIKF